MALPRDIAHRGDRPLTIADQQEQGELQLAWGHAMWRNNLVAKVFCYLSVMRAAGLISGQARVEVSPVSLSVPQDFQATKGNQAAHYLPGFVAIEDAGKHLRYMWEFVTEKSTRDEIANLFGATQDLPRNYNFADSAAEGRARLGPMGLKKIFEACCQTILRLHPPHSRATGEALVCVSRPAVMATWRQWTQQSITAYQRAGSAKETRVAQNRPADVHAAPATDLAQGKLNEWTPAEIVARVRDLDRAVSDSKSSVSGFLDQTSFLRAYANVTSQEFPLSGAVIRQIEDRFTKMPDWYEK